MRDLTNKLRNVVAVLAIILTAIFAFTPLLSFDLNDDARLEWEMEKVVTNAKMMEKINEGKIDDEKYQKLDEYFNQNENSVEYNAIAFIKAIPNTIKYFKAFVDIQNCEDLEAEYESSLDDETSDEYHENQYKELEEARAKLREIDYKAVTIESLDQFRWIFTALNPSVVLDKENTAVDAIFLIVSAIIKLIFAFVILVMFPLVMVISVLKLLAALLKRDEGKVLLISRDTYSWSAFLLAVSALWKAHLTKTGVFLVVVTAVVIVFNIVASWLSKKVGETKLLAATQVCSFISAIGLWIFITNILKAELGGVANVNSDGNIEIETAAPILIFTILLMLLMPIIYTGIVSVLARAGNVHYGISGKKKSEGVGTALIFAIIVVVCNIVLRNKYAIELSKEQGSAFTMACVGLGIAIVGSIAFAVIKPRMQSYE